jgi:hypothetical protein
MEATRDDVVVVFEPLLRLTTDVERTRRRELTSSLAVLHVVAAQPSPLDGRAAGFTGRG